MLRLVLALFLVLTPLLPAQGMDIRARNQFAKHDISKESPASLEKISRITDRILKFGGSNDTLYVFIGSSPLIFAADLESRLGPGHVVKIPLSAAQVLKNHLVTQVAVDKVMFPYLDHFLARHSPAQFARLVLVDYAVTGDSIAGTELLMRRYLSEKGLNEINMDTLILSGAPPLNENHYSRAIPFNREMDDRLYRRDFAYLRLYEKTTVYQWLNWADANDLSGLTAKIEAGRLQGGHERYQKAVNHFAQTPRPISLVSKIFSYCSQVLLKPGKPTSR